MKILQINSVYQYSSTGRTTKELHLFFKNKGIQSFVICTNYSDCNNIYKVGSLIDGKVHAFLTRLTGLRGYFSFRYTRVIEKKIEEIDPDIIILRNLHNNYVHVPHLLDYIARRNIKTIWVLHDCWAYTGGCTHYTIHGCKEWLNGCPKCGFRKEALNSWFFNTSAKLYKDRVKYFGAIKDLTIVGVSDWITNEAKLSFLKDIAKRIVRCYNWIDLDTFFPRDTLDLKRKLNIEESDFVVLGVAQTWAEDKGLSHFLNVAKALTDVKFVMVGNLSASVPDNVIPIGVLSNVHELAEYNSMADVFVNFTQQETFGKVSAEALACGTPAIVNNNTACPEVVGDCGFIIENNDEKACIEAIQHIRKVGKISYSDKCVTRARTMFSKELILGQWLDLLEEIYKS